MTGYHTLKESNGDHMPQELATMANLAWRQSETRAALIGSMPLSEQKRRRFV